MSRLSDLATKATMKAYAQGAAQNAVAPIADFLAPTVEVATPVGEYQAYDDKTRFQIPNTERAPGADAVKLGFGSSPATYNCRHNSLDIPVDIQEQDADEFALQDAINMASEVGSLAHEKKVIDLALAAVGAGTDITLSNAGTNLISSFDTAILNILKIAGYGSLMISGGMRQRGGRGMRGRVEPTTPALASPADSETVSGMSTANSQRATWRSMEMASS